MPRPASIKHAVKPTAIHDVRGRGRMALYGLAEAKNALQIPLEDSHNDDDLILLVATAQSFVEKATSLYLAPGSVDIDWELPSGVSALEIPLSDVVSITSITEYAADGSTSTLDAGNYEGYHRRGRYYIARTDGETFPYGPGVVAVRVRVLRGLDADSADEALVRGAMNYVVRELDKPDGMTRLGDLRNNQAWQRLAKLLQANVVQAGAF